MKTTCGHNCHLLRTGCECSPCKYKPQTDIIMNTDKIIIEELKERITKLQLENMQLRSKKDADIRPKEAINKALPLLVGCAFSARGIMKDRIKELIRTLDYESTERTVATTN